MVRLNDSPAVRLYGLQLPPVPVHLYGSMTLSLRRIFNSVGAENVYEQFLLKLAAEAANALYESEKEHVKDGIIVREPYPKLDIGLDNLRWQWSVSESATDEESPGVLKKIDFSNKKKAMVIGGFIFKDAEPVITHIGFKKGTQRTALADVYAGKDEYGVLLLRFKGKIRPDEDMEIIYLAPTTGTLTMIPIAFVAEPKAETADWLI